MGIINYYKIVITFIDKNTLEHCGTDKKIIISYNNFSAIKAVEKYAENRKIDIINTCNKVNPILKIVLNSAELYLYNISKPNEDGSIDSGLGDLIFNWSINNKKTLEETIREKLIGRYYKESRNV